MIVSEIRKKNGGYKSQKIIDIVVDIDAEIKHLYKKYKGVISYDALHLLICDNSHAERTWQIATQI